MPKLARDATRGLIPTRKGYALRVRKDAEGEITTNLNPAEATRLGPALGIRPKSAWVIKGVPAYADTGMIVKTIAQTTSHWPGWVIRPRRPLTSSRGRVNTWLVDAVVEPPSKVITLNGFIISIEKYIEAPVKGTRTNAWLTVKPKISHEIIPGQIYEDEDAHAEEEDNNESRSPDPPLQGDGPKKKIRDIEMQSADEEEIRVTKRKLDSDNQKACDVEAGVARGVGTNAADGKDTMINKLLESLAQKDEQIAKMMTKIDSLQAQLGKLTDLLLKQQSESLTVPTDSNSDL